MKSKYLGTLIFYCAVALALTDCGEQQSDMPVDSVGTGTVVDDSLSTTIYASQNRPDVRGQIGAVSAGHPLAAQAGLRVLQEGGNATDAMIAMAGVLAVVRPHMNGIGGTEQPSPLYTHTNDRISMTSRFIAEDLYVCACVFVYV